MVTSLCLFPLWLKTPAHHKPSHLLVLTEVGSGSSCGPSWPRRLPRWRPFSSFSGRDLTWQRNNCHAPPGRGSRTQAYGLNATTSGRVLRSWVPGAPPPSSLVSQAGSFPALRSHIPRVQASALYRLWGSRPVPSSLRLRRLDPRVWQPLVVVPSYLHRELSFSPSRGPW